MTATSHGALALPAAVRASLPSALHDLRGHQHLPRLGPAALTAGGARRGSRRRPLSNTRGPPIGRLGALVAAPQTKVQCPGWRFSAAGVRCALTAVGGMYCTALPLLAVGIRRLSSRSRRPPLLWPTLALGADAPPAFTSPPAVQGDAVVGATLTATATWTGDPAPTVKYQWRRCPATGGSCDPDHRRHRGEVRRGDRRPRLPARRADHAQEHGRLDQPAVGDDRRGGGRIDADAPRRRPTPPPTPTPTPNPAARPDARSDSGVGDQLHRAGGAHRGHQGTRHAAAALPDRAHPRLLQARWRARHPAVGQRAELRDRRGALRGLGLPVRSVSVASAPARLRAFERFLPAGTVLQVRVTSAGASASTRASSSAPTRLHCARTSA